MRCFEVNVREEATEYGFMPTLRLYLLDQGSRPRPLVIVAPGGGYSTVCVESDGDRIAARYNAAGFHAAVLRYSVSPHCFPEPQRDMLLAVGLCRKNACQWGILEDRIALCGFSAGGHLCASAGTLWHKSGNELYRPNATILCFAVLTTRLGHCRMFLEDHVGAGNEEKLKLVSCDRQVSETTAPAFLVGTVEDRLANVENMLYYAEALTEHGVPFELHVLPKGGHCASWFDDTIWAKPVAERTFDYIGLSVDWLRELWSL